MPKKSKNIKKLNKKLSNKLEVQARKDFKKSELERIYQNYEDSN